MRVAIPVLVEVRVARANVQALAEGLQLNVLDRLVDDGERLWVLDYKTHRAGDAGTVLAGAAEQLRRRASRAHIARSKSAGGSGTAAASTALSVDVISCHTG